MSTGMDGKYICCDGEDCQARALAPVALRSLLPRNPETSCSGSAFSAEGWLFVHENGRTRHFCPRCAPHYLSALSSSERISATSP